MNNLFFPLGHVRYYSKTVRALVKLISHKNFSDWDLNENLFLLIDFIIEKTFSNSKNFLIKSRKDALTFDDLKNSFSTFLDVKFLANFSTFYKKIIKKYNFLSPYIKKKMKSGPPNEKTSFVIQSWISLDLDNDIKKKKHTIDPKFKHLYESRCEKKFHLNNTSFSFFDPKQRYFYKFFIMVFEKGNKEEHEAFLGSLSEDKGLGKLVPYILLYLNQFFAKNQVLPKFKLGLKIIFALFLNDFYKVEPFFSQILPILVNCLIGEISNKIDEETINLKFFAGKLLGFFFRRFSLNYSGIQSKIIFLLSNNLMKLNESVEKVVGALIGLSSLGIEITELYVIPYFPLIINCIGQKIRNQKFKQIQIKLLRYLIDLIVTTSVSYLVKKNLQVLIDKNLYFSDRLIFEKILKIFPQLDDLRKVFPHK